MRDNAENSSTMLIAINLPNLNRSSLHYITIHYSDNVFEKL